MLSELEKKLCTACDDKNFEEFEKTLQSPGSYDPEQIIGYVLWSDDYRFLEAIVRRHPTVRYEDIDCILPRIEEKNYDLLEVLFQKMVPKTPNVVFEILCAAQMYPDKLSIALRVLLQDCSISHDQLALLLYTSMRNSNDPIAYIRAFVDGGVDISGFHYILPDYLRYGKIVPGVARELIKHGIPRSAAYVAEYLKSARYRSRILNELH